MLPKLLLAIVLFASLLANGALRAQNNIHPLLVLIEYDAWAMVMGADSPTFALYDDGTVIFVKHKGDRRYYASAELTELDVSRFLKQIGVESFDTGSYSLSDATDQPRETIQIRMQNGSYKQVSVYGSLRVGNDSSYPQGVPKHVVDLYQALTGYDNPQATEWLPDFIEVMIWPYDYAPDTDLLWPKDWPDLSDARTVKRGEDSYSLYINKARIEELRSLLASRREKQAIRISGKKWAADVRIPFPQEQVWMGHE